MTYGKKQILVCDDSLFIRTKLREFISGTKGCEVLEASDGQAAIDLYKENKPHLVIMDLVMPVRNGLEALSAIKEFDPLAKVVILSSSGTKSHLKKAIEAGAYDFLQKPWNEAQITRIMDKTLS